MQENKQKELYLAIMKYANSEKEFSKYRLQDIDYLLSKNEGLAQSLNPVTGQTVLIRPEVMQGMDPAKMPDLLETFYKHGFKDTSIFLKTWMDDMIAENHKFDHLSYIPIDKSTSRLYGKANSLDAIMDVVEKYEGKRVKTEKLLNISANLIPNAYKALLRRAQKEDLSQEYLHYIKTAKHFDKNVILEFQAHGVDITKGGIDPSVYSTYLFKNPNVSLEGIRTLELCGIDTPDNAIEQLITSTLDNTNPRTQLSERTCEDVTNYLVQTVNVSDPKVSQKIMDAISEAMQYSPVNPESELRNTAKVLKVLQTHGLDCQAKDSNGNNLKMIMAKNIEKIEFAVPEFKELIQEIEPRYNHENQNPTDALEESLFAYANDEKGGTGIVTLRMINQCIDMGLDIDPNKIISALAQNFEERRNSWDEDEQYVVAKIESMNAEEFLELPKDIMLNKEGFYGLLTMNIDPEQIALRHLRSLKEYPEIEPYLEEEYKACALLYAQRKTEASNELIEEFKQHGVDLEDYMISASCGEFDEIYKDDILKYPSAQSSVVIRKAQMSMDAKTELENTIHKMKLERAESKDYRIQ